MTDLTVNKNLIEVLQKKADQLKGNGDGKLETHEKDAITLFNYTIDNLHKNGKINDATFKEAMGLYMTKPETKLSKDEKKHFETTRKVFEEELEYVIKNKRATKETLVAQLTEKLDGNATVEPYATYIKNVDSLLTKKLKKNLEENAEFNKAYTFIEDAFKKQVDMIKTANPELTYQQAQMSVDHDKFLKDIKKALKGNEQRKEAVNAFKKNVLKTAAFTVAMTEVSSQNSEKWRDVRSDSKDGMKEDGTWNEYTKSALKGNSFKNRITGKSSVGKMASQAQANSNSVKNSTWQTENDIIKTIGRELFEKLKGAVDSETNNPLIEKSDDGLWNISNLQEALTNMVGKGDHEWSRHNKKIDNNTSEIARSQGQITLYNALENCSKEDVEKLIELCGIPKEKKDWYRATLGALIGATIGFANGVAAGGVAAETNPNQVVKDGDINLDASTYLEINIQNGESISIDPSNLPKGTTVTQIGTSIIVDIDKFINIPGAVVELSKHVSKTALKAGLASAIAPAIAGFISGLKDVGEIEVFSKYLDGTDLEAYAERVSKEAPKFAPYAILLATYFSKGGIIDTVAMEQFLEDMGGHGGKVNPKELQGLILDMLRNKPVVEEIETKTKQNGECSVDKCTLNVTPETTDGTCSHIVKQGDTWGNMVRAYYPDLVAKYGEYGAVKKWQKAMFTDENGNFNKKEYKALTQNRTLTDKNGKGLELPLPTEIDGCKRAGCGDDITIKKASEAELAGSEEYRSKNYGKATTTLGQLVGIHRAPQTTYTATDDCDNTTVRGFATEKEAVEALKKQTNKTYDNEDDYLK